MTLTKRFADLDRHDVGKTLVWKTRGRTKRAILDGVEHLTTHTVAYVVQGRRVDPLVLTQEDMVTVEP